MTAAERIVPCGGAPLPGDASACLALQRAREVGRVGDDRLAARRQDPPDLAQKRGPFPDVFDHFEGNDKVESAGSKWHRGARRLKESYIRGAAH